MIGRRTFLKSVVALAATLPVSKLPELPQEGGFVKEAVDPVLHFEQHPQYAMGVDFCAEYPTPLDPQEILSLCEETAITVWRKGAGPYNRALVAMLSAMSKEWIDAAVNFEFVPRG